MPQSMPSAARSLTLPFSDRCRTLHRLVAAGLALMLFAVAPPAVHGEERSPYAAQLEAAYAADGPGAAAIVVRDGHVVFRGARGMADLELEVPLRPEHVFRLGSITKQFTGAAIMILADQGKLSPEDEITQYLPDYPTHGHAITIEHLLTHTSGIFNYTNDGDYMGGVGIRADLSTEELVDVFDHVAMDFAPGTRWNYSNSGYVLLGAIIEEVSGMSYADFVQQHIFDPLAMENSHYGGPQLIPRRVEGFSGGPGNYANATFLSMTQPHAAGSLLSTVDDLMRWNGGLFGGKLLSAESIERMTRKFVLNDGEEADYGYGFSLSEFRGEPSIGHGGGIPGFSTYAMWLPESKIYVAVLSNNPENATRPVEVAQTMAATALGRPFPVRTAIALSPEALEEFVGVYQIDDTSSRSVIVEDGRIYTQRTGSRRFEVFPYADNAFFYDPGFSYITFERDESGKVTTMLMHPDGVDEAQVCPRTGDVPAAPEPARQTAEVSPEIYDLWAGTFEIRPGFELVVHRDGDRLISQATGQPAFELHPASVYRFFVQEFEAEIAFEAGDDGRAQAIVLYQGGQEIRAERID